MPESKDTALAFVRLQFKRYPMATPAKLLALAKQSEFDTSRQSIMVSIRQLLEAGEIVKLGRGGYATPAAADDQNLRAAVRLFLLTETSPVWLQVPSKKHRGEWEDYEQWRAHSAHSAAKKWAASHDFDLPAALFESEIKNLVEEGLLRPVDINLNASGHYWATSKGRKLAKILS